MRVTLRLCKRYLDSAICEVLGEVRGQPVQKLLGFLAERCTCEGADSNGCEYSIASLGRLQSVVPSATYVVTALQPCHADMPQTWQ